jgi:hypothetical protein
MPWDEFSGVIIIRWQQVSAAVSENGIDFVLGPGFGPTASWRPSRTQFNVRPSVCPVLHNRRGGMCQLWYIEQKFGGMKEFIAGQAVPAALIEG